MTNEAAGGDACGELPEPQGLIPGGGESIGTVGGDDTVGDNVRVAMKGSLWIAVVGFVAGQVPDDESLIAGSGEEHVGVLEGSCEGGDPAAVALELA